MERAGLTWVSPVYVNLTQLEANSPELFMLLGEIKQSVADIKDRLDKQTRSEARIEQRVTSLERSRLWVKAYAGGVIAAIGAGYWMVHNLYTALHK